MFNLVKMLILINGGMNDEEVNGNVNGNGNVDGIDQYGNGL
jgi:hypothetical protein